MATLRRLTSHSTTTTRALESSAPSLVLEGKFRFWGEGVSNQRRRGICTTTTNRQWIHPGMTCAVPVQHGPMALLPRADIPRGPLRTASTGTTLRCMVCLRTRRNGRIRPRPSNIRPTRGIWEATGKSPSEDTSRTWGGSEKLKTEMNPVRQRNDGATTARIRRVRRICVHG